MFVVIQIHVIMTYMIFDDGFFFFFLNFYLFTISNKKISGFLFGFRVKFSSFVYSDYFEIFLAFCAYSGT